MGRKHSKNAGVMGSEALTYHEKKALGYGTATERLGKVGGGGREGRPGRMRSTLQLTLQLREHACCSLPVLTVTPARGCVLWRRTRSATITTAVSR